MTIKEADKLRQKSFGYMEKFKNKYNRSPNVFEISRFIIKECEAEKKELLQKNRDLEAVLERNGFRRCDIPACNCGSWHDERRDHEISELEHERKKLIGKIKKRSCVVKKHDAEGKLREVRIFEDMWEDDWQKLEKEREK